MSQHDMNIANADGATVRADINNALAALAGMSSGATAPATTFPYQPWADTANDRLKIRNAANTAWIEALILSTGAPVVSSSTHGVQDFRLTLTSGVAVTTSDVTSASTLYCMPYIGKSIGLYSGSAWVLRQSNQFSIALSALTSGRPYDVFCYDNSGTPTLELTAWTNATTRATALAYQDGVLVKNGAATRRYLGTLYTTGTTTTEDSVANRYLYNYYNRAPRKLKAVDTTDNWTYTTNAYRQARASSANQINFVIGVSEDVVTAQAVHCARNTVAGVAFFSAIGLDSTTERAADCICGRAGAYSANNEAILTSSYNGFPGVGLHYLSLLEASSASGTTTWLGDDGGTNIQTGISGVILA